MEGEQKVYLAAANGYSEKYYLNDIFSKLPVQVKDEIQMILVSFALDVGGVIALYFDESDNLKIELNKESDDFFYDEIGAEVKVREITRRDEELFRSLELYYKKLVKGDEDE